MKVKRYETTDLLATTERIRGELGREAVIIATRRIGGGGLLRRAARFEILAGVPDPGASTPDVADVAAPSVDDEGVLESPGVRLALSDPALAQRIARAAAERAASADLRPQERAPSAARSPFDTSDAPDDALAPPPQTALAVLGTRLGAIEQEVRQLRDRRRTGIDAQLQGAAADLIDRLGERGLDARLIATLSAEALGAAGDPAAEVRRSLAKRLPAATLRLPKGRRQLIVVVGPHSSGKTTAAVKLAASLQAEGRRVLLASLDTSRVAGEARLLAFARALEVPARVCYGAGELTEATRGAGLDTVIVDTPGFNAYAPGDAIELRRMIDGLSEPRVLLAIPAGMSAADVEATYEMGGRGSAGVVLTGSDATGTPGGALSALTTLGAPALLIGDSHDVLRPLLPAEREMLARLALGEALRAAAPSPQRAARIGA